MARADPELRPAPGAEHRRGLAFLSVMPGLVPGIHVFMGRRNQSVDGRDKPGYDGGDMHAN